MPPRNTFLSQVLEIWSRLHPGQRLSLLFFSLLVLGGIGALVYFMGQVEYEVLYRDLNPEDAQAIAGKLKDEKRDFRTTADGTSILVAGSKAEVDKLRLEIAGSGLARSGRVGFEIFDKNQFGMTDFTEQINYKRALEGELSRTISSLSEISMARVHLVLPKDSLFEEKKEAAKASVLVRLKKGSELPKTSIAGIVNLAASAVPGLHTYNVSVVDWEGNLLSRPTPGGDGVRTEIESGIRAGLEREMVQKVVSILEPVVGKGKVHANASIDLEFNSSEETEESFNPSPPVILSQQKSEERMGGTSAVSGIPGTQSNQTPPPPATQASTPERLRQSELTNYEVSKVVRHTIQPKGSVKRLSVAVILDHKTVYAKSADGKVTSTSQARPQKDLDAYKELVLAAVGYDKERGDTVTLENVPFFNEVAPEEDRPPLPWYVKWQPYLLPTIKYAAFLILFLLVYFILFRPIRKRVLQTISNLPPLLGAPAQPPEAEGAARMKALRESPAGNELPGAALDSRAIAASGEEAALDDSVMSPERFDDQIQRELTKEALGVGFEGRKYAVLKKKLIDHASKEPESVSQLIRTWILEKESS